MRALPQAFFERSALEVAPALLGATLVHEVNGMRRAGRIVETEAYLPDDPAFHGWNAVDPTSGMIRLTGRTAPLFGPPGVAYIYLVYGMYWLFNIVTERPGTGGCVLIRALEPLEGLSAMMEARGTSRVRALCNGPGKLVQALGIRPEQQGTDITLGPLFVEPADAKAGYEVGCSSRIGLTRGIALPYRFYFDGHPDVSPGIPSDIAVARRQSKLARGVRALDAQKHRRGRGDGV